MSDAPPDWYSRNQAYARPGPYTTMLSPTQELLFKLWLQSNAVPFNPNAAGPQDYDMRGFWLSSQLGEPRAQSAVNPNDQQIHYPDYWKTPYHESFSAESQWALPGAPSWNEKDQLVDKAGNIVFDEKAKAR